MLASYPASILNHKTETAGIPTDSNKRGNALKLTSKPFMGQFPDEHEKARAELSFNASLFAARDTREGFASATHYQNDRRSKQSKLVKMT